MPDDFSKFLGITMAKAGWLPWVVEHNGAVMRELRRLQEHVSIEYSIDRYIAAAASLRADMQPEGFDRAQMLLLSAVAFNDFDIEGEVARMFAEAPDRHIEYKTYRPHSPLLAASLPPSTPSGGPLRGPRNQPAGTLIADQNGVPSVVGTFGRALHPIVAGGDAAVPAYEKWASMSSTASRVRSPESIVVTRRPGKCSSYQICFVSQWFRYPSSSIRPRCSQYHS
jgi:hypothetical protein